MIEKLDGFEVTLQRSCNDQGLLYGSVTQRDIADALVENGFEIKPRDVRLPHTIKRVDSFEVHIKLDSDLEADIKLWVVPDRELEVDEREEMEFDEEGNLIVKGEERQRAPRGPAVDAIAGDE
jgi:large subunit ribosomal protein L9